MDKHLRIEPQELRFPFQLGNEVSCLVRLSNKTSKHVAFKVMSTNPGRYCVRPNLGTVSPGSSCDVTVIMSAQNYVPQNMQSKDKFSIRSALVSPAATTKDVKELLKSRDGNLVQECKLRVIYTVPPQVRSPVAVRPVVQGINRNETNAGNFFNRCIVIGFLGLIFWYLVKKLLALTWSVTFVITMLAGRMIRSIISDSVEDWIVKALVYIFCHFISVLLGRKWNIPVS